MARPTNAQRDADLLNEVKNCFQDAETTDSYNREMMRQDLDFCYVPGAQWDAQQLLRRQGRPNYSYNRTVQAVNQVVGDQRQASFSGRVRAASKDAARETADVYSGLIRDIESRSHAVDIYNDQFKMAVAGAFGSWRIYPEYVGEETFDQHLCIKPITNPFTVYWDTAAVDPCRADANWCLVAERKLKSVFEDEYPDAIATSIEVPHDSRGWVTDKEVRIAEYFKRTCKNAKIAKLNDGRTITYDPQVRAIMAELEEMSAGGMPLPTVMLDANDRPMIRAVKLWRVTWWKVSGADVLEGPIEYKWKRIPVIRVPGRCVNIEGKEYVQSLIRHSKDAQRTYNYNRSTMVETVALTPRAPYIATGKMVKGYEDQWARANAVNQPYLLYDVDPAAPGARPQREPPPDIPDALSQLAAADAEDIKQTTGYVNPAMPADQPSDTESGIALTRRLVAGGAGAYEFTDNLKRAVVLTWECCVDMIPSVYDTERIVRIIGADEVEKYVTVNGADPNDPKAVPIMLAQGAFDVVMTVGPAYATARQEAASTLLDAVEKVPIIAEEASDIIVKNLDIQDGDEITKRVRQRMIREGKLQPDEHDLKDMPPPPPPDPVQTAMVNRLTAQTDKDAAAAQKTQAEVQLLPLDLEQRIADIVNTRLESLKLAGEVAQTGADKVQAERKKTTDAVPAT